MITPESIVHVVPGQVSTELGGEVAILSLDDGIYYGLDDVGAFIWRQIQVPRRVQDLRSAVLAAYDVDEGQCEVDLLRILGELETHGLIQVETLSTS